ncbi:MAG: hypothetical protein Q7T11_07115, partial [Deltaproteobacteria bacterium]|nr:hypothetical protein [Deltaproteobacteria bacterium]
SKVKEKAQQNDAEAGKAVKEGAKDDTGNKVSMVGTAAMTIGAFLPWPANAIVVVVGLVAMIAGQVMQKNADKKAATVASQVDNEAVQKKADAATADSRGIRGQNIIEENQLTPQPAAQPSAQAAVTLESGEKTA